MNERQIKSDADMERQARDLVRRNGPVAVVWDPVPDLGGLMRVVMAGRVERGIRVWRISGRPVWLRGKVPELVRETISIMPPLPWRQRLEIQSALFDFQEQCDEAVEEVQRRQRVEKWLP